MLPHVLMCVIVSSALHTDVVLGCAGFRAKAPTVGCGPASGIVVGVVRCWMGMGPFGYSCCDFFPLGIGILCLRVRAAICSPSYICHVGAYSYAPFGECSTHIVCAPTIDVQRFCLLHSFPCALRLSDSNLSVLRVECDSWINIVAWIFLFLLPLKLLHVSGQFLCSIPRICPSLDCLHSPSASPVLVLTPDRHCAPRQFEPASSLVLLSNAASTAGVVNSGTLAVCRWEIRSEVDGISNCRG